MAIQHPGRPVLVVDESICRRNINRMQQKANNSGALLRPHFKTHRSVAIGNWFRQAGINAITVSSVEMAQMFANDGWEDILIAFPVNFSELSEINKLAATCKLGLTVSCYQAADLLSGRIHEAVDVWLKIDVGTHRTGFDPLQTNALVRSFKHLSNDPFITVKGVLAHAGHTYQARSHQEIVRIYEDSRGILQACVNELHHSLPDAGKLLISWGDTPSCSILDRFEGIDEIRPGNFVFYDQMQLSLGVCHPPDIAASVSAPVVALHPEREEVVVYAGAMHLSKETGLCPNGLPHYGRVVFYRPDGKLEWPDEAYWVRRVSQEHGVVQLPRKVIGQLSLGQNLAIIPVHSCLVHVEVVSL